MRQLISLGLLAACLPWAGAQRSAVRTAHAGYSHPGTRSHAQRVEAGTNWGAYRHGSYGPFLLPYGFLADDAGSASVNYSDLNLTDPAEPALPVNRAEGPMPAGARPLLIELRGDSYVRLEDENVGWGEAARNQTAAASRARGPGNQPAPPLSGALATVSRPPASSHPVPEAQDLAPVTLIFRDGHKEEVRDYSIIDGIIYARGNYYVDGFWNKQIALASLNLSETFKSNEMRGLHFAIPSSPNEVITRP
jgi:hypothetical protein